MCATVSPDNFHGLTLIKIKYGILLVSGSYYGQFSIKKKKKERF